MLKHRTLLRSLMVTSDKKNIKLLSDNFNKIYNSKIVFPIDLHIKLYNYICNHILKLTDPPSFDLLYKTFEMDNQVTEELSKIESEKPLFEKDFEALILEIVAEQQKTDLAQILRDTAKISEMGLKLKNSYLQGTEDAIDYLMKNSLELVKPIFTNKNEGGTKTDSIQAFEKYLEVKHQNKFNGLLSGLETLDLSTKGIFPNDFWIIAAYVSELKTTLSMNLAYAQAIEQRKNVKFVSLEMSYKECLDIFVAIHSANFNLWAGSSWDDVWPLDYENIVEGSLNERQEEFFEFLCHDLMENPEYGNIHIYKPEDGLSVSKLWSWSESEYRKEPFEIIYLDYIELMEAENKNKEYTTELNQRIKDLRQFTLNFNKGIGMRLVSAYQINRKGKEAADKNDGEYRLDALSYANEAERSASVVIYSYLNEDLRANNEVKIGCLKNRSRAKFKQFICKTRLASRKIYQLPGSSLEEEVVPKKGSSTTARKKEATVEDII